MYIVAEKFASFFFFFLLGRGVGDKSRTEYQKKDGKKGCNRGMWKAYKKCSQKGVLELKSRESKSLKMKWKKSKKILESSDS